jgi:hypothetical protein
MPKTDLKSGKVRQWTERYQWPLGIAVLLLIAEVLMPEQSPRPREPRRTTASTGRTVEA